MYIRGLCLNYFVNFILHYYITETVIMKKKSTLITLMSGETATGGTIVTCENNFRVKRK